MLLSGIEFDTTSLNDATPLIEFAPNEACKSIGGTADDFGTIGRKPLAQIRIT
jgi:hypothetical protein